MANGPGDGIGHVDIVCIEVDVEGHEEEASTDRGCPCRLVDPVRSEIRFAVRITPDRLAQSLELATSDVGEIDSVRTGGRLLVEVRRNLGSFGERLGELDRQLDAIVHVYASDWYKWDDVDGSHAGMFTLVLGHVDVLDRCHGEIECCSHDRVGLTDEGHIGAVVVRVGGDVDHRHCVVIEGTDDLVDNCLVSAVTEIRYTLYKLHTRRSPGDHLKDASCRSDLCTVVANDSTLIMAALQTVVHGAETLVLGPDTDDAITVIEDGAVAITDGRVVESGSTASIVREYPPENAEFELDATGKTVVPGFVDSHTHAVYAGDRADEFEARLSGVSYQELLAEGGGILRTVNAVCSATVEQLRDRLLDRLDIMLAHGATMVEVKSGYGLDVESELKMLRAVEAADRSHPVDLVPTFLGAHAVPQGEDQSAYVEQVVDEQIPAVLDAGLAEFGDVFCDEGAFSLDESRTVLEAVAEAGLGVKIHADEFARLGGAELAAELGATSADHLLQSTAADARTLGEHGVVPTLLPGTAFTLGVEYADAQQFIDAGAWPAIASDFNPNCHLSSMVATIHFACHGMGMTPGVAIRGATSEGARALDRADEYGRLQPGAVGDLVVADVPSHVHLAYQFGVNPIETVIKGGERVHG